MAVHMLAIVWMLARRDTVKNCFTHAGFQPEQMNLACTSDDVKAADDVEPGQNAKTAAAWTALENAGIVPESIALSDYVDAHADVIVYKRLSSSGVLAWVPPLLIHWNNNKAAHVQWS